MPSPTHVPFSPSGHQLSYHSRYFPRPGQIEWRPNDGFDATLTFAGFERTRAGDRSIWKDKDGNQYTMFASVLEKLLQHFSLCCGRVTARWCFIKRGEYYSIKPVHPLI